MCCNLPKSTNRFDIRCVSEVVVTTCRSTPCCRLHFRKRTTTSSQFKNMSSRTNWKQKTTAELLPQTHLYGETNNIRSLSSVTVPSIVEVTVDNQRSAPGSATLRDLLQELLDRDLLVILQVLCHSFRGTRPSCFDGGSIVCRICASSHVAPPLCRKWATSQTRTSGRLPRQQGRTSLAE